MNAGAQRRLLDRLDQQAPFAGRLQGCGDYPLRAAGVDILQMNITRRCNLHCRHCHVEGSPEREGEMSRDDLEACLRTAAEASVKVLDITGGAPELHPDLEWFLGNAAQLRTRLLVRSNGVILLTPPYDRFVEVYAANGVEVVVSLPHLHAKRTDRMRGNGVFDRLLAALRLLNEQGYGKPGSGLLLHLVHNPSGAFLPAAQQALEADYRHRLEEDFGIEFNQLFCLNNCPVGRYLEFLESSGNLEPYLELLRRSYNPAAVSQVMCRTTLSVGCDGRLFDCDFNQALDLGVAVPESTHIRDFSLERLGKRSIVVGTHCYGCTAGAGSSCQGTLDA
jgi:radical SAM/Cys-rich protein